MNVTVPGSSVQAACDHSEQSMHWVHSSLGVDAWYKEQR